MTQYFDFEADELPGDPLSASFDLVVVGGGAAGLTIVRELSGLGLNILLLESGGLEESADHEALNDVDVEGSLQDAELQRSRHASHAFQLKFWTTQTQKFGVRCRVLGGSTAGWAGKVAPFDALDFAAREWIADSGWPITASDLAPYIQRAARHLDVGPILGGPAFWPAAKLREPAEMARMKHVSSFFWQLARSHRNLTDVMRFGPDFRSESHRGVTTVFNATVRAIQTDRTGVTGVEIVSSLSGKRRRTLLSSHVVLAAGAIENARLLLLSRDEVGNALGNARGVVGRYLTDHPCMSIGEFSPDSQASAAALLGFFSLQQDYRAFMYSHGLAIRPDVQQAQRLPNMAAYANARISNDDPVVALKRLAKRQSERPLADLILVLQRSGVVVSFVGRRILGSSILPRRVRRLIVDAVIRLDANFVARDYVAKGTGRKIEKVTLDVICEQPPMRENRVTLSSRCDRLGLPVASVTWESGSAMKQAVVTFARLLDGDFRDAGIQGFALRPEIAAGDLSAIALHDMAHTAGTTRMGQDPATSVVDADCRVHDVRGLHIAGASVFPTSGHANPTMVIMALAIRLADHLKSQLVARRIAALTRPAAANDDTRPLVLVTGATGNLGAHVVDQLILQGYRVRGQFHRKVPADARVEWVAVDFSDRELADAALDELVDGVTAVVHLAAGLPGTPDLETINVANLERFAQACIRRGVGYFGHASSMVVYGSPRHRLVDETAPLLDMTRPIEKQYFEAPEMRDYARSKRIGEDILSRCSASMHVDLYRIALAQQPGYLEASLRWSRTKRLFALYRNSHYISPHNVARAIVHLLRRSIDSAKRDGIDAFNIADTHSPTYEEVYRRAGRKPIVHVPLLADVAKSLAVGKTVKKRYPMGFYRLDDSKLRSTGFVLDRQD
ncbi:GMC oxidoreductase [Burkholderia sp. IDO3]|uniref:GMC oxidoreductase n=1 Tax=Burkholderia sp. IDO3 TaxID=1705310 RepID=UPI000BBB4F49|nr:GMC oxidoreductase [Burkholderia sp. IDO3]AXK67443.1 NAD-dependent epimerase/dehydratase family protein [Burkholderia sp. IDO3]PCD60075.1 epimerase [Burkholderia sp. IDO3]